MRIPTPFDAIDLVGRAAGAVEEAISLVPRLVSLIGQAERLVQRADGIVGAIEQTVAGADAVLAETSAVVDRTDALTRRVDVLLAKYESPLHQLHPIVVRLVETSEEHEVEAVVRMINLLPALVDQLGTDILPVLDTLGTVAPDLRDLLDLSRELNEMLGSLPGMGRVKKRIEEEQAERDDGRAEEEVSTAPDRG